MTTAIITGATGYIGQILLNHLVKNGTHVRVVVRPQSVVTELVKFQSKVTIHYYDGTYSSMTKIFTDLAEPATVFHLAAVTAYQHTTDNIDLMLDANIKLGAHLLEAMSKSNCRNFINTGTFWQHNNDETYQPVCLYAASKQAFEAILDFYVITGKVNAITLKLLDIYGPTDPRPKLFNLLAKAAADNTTLDMSPGEQLLDLIYIDDVIAAYLAAEKYLRKTISSKQHDRYFVTSEKLISLKDIVSLYQRIVKKTIRINWGARPYRDREVMHPWNKPVLPGWKAQTDLATGIHNLINSR